MILAGDLNIRPGSNTFDRTDAIGFRNLVEIFGTETTRIAKNYGVEKTLAEPFADYILPTCRVECVRFFFDTWSENQPSDHAPGYLSFNLF